MPAEQFVTHKTFSLVLAGVDSRTTALMGHTRWRTRGDEHVNRNNHPIRAGEVIGTHNGTIYNADELFRRYGLPRYAQVDSEILFRIAATTVTKRGRIDARRLATRLRHCQGQITAVMACRRDARTVLVLKGNNPLELRWHPHMRVLMYASSASYLDAVLDGDGDWCDLLAPSMTLLIFHSDRLTTPASTPLEFVAISPSESDDFWKLHQLQFDDLEDIDD